MSFRDRLHRLRPDTAGNSTTQWRDLDPGSGIGHPVHRVADELGGGPVRLVNLGPGHLSDLAFIDADGRTILETTRYGLMPGNWEGADFVDRGIKHVTEIAARPASETMRVFDTVIHAAADWDWNFQHFLTESFPRLYFLNQFLPADCDVAVTVGDYPHVLEVLQACFPKMRTLQLKRGETLRVTGNCFFVPPVFKNIGFHTDFSREALRGLRECYLRAWRPSGLPSPPAGYFGRKTDALYAGNSRVLVNDAELRDIARGRGYHEVYFDGLTNLEKMDLLNGMTRAIMPVGANLMNLVLAPNPIDLIVVMHPVFRPIDWFRETLNAAGAPIRRFDVFGKTCMVENAEYIANSPFRANANEFHQFLLSKAPK